MMKFFNCFFLNKSFLNYYADHRMYSLNTNHPKKYFHHQSCLQKIFFRYMVCLLIENNINVLNSINETRLDSFINYPAPSLAQSTIGVDHVKQHNTKNSTKNHSNSQSIKLSGYLAYSLISVITNTRVYRMFKINLEKYFNRKDEGFSASLVTTGANGGKYI